MINFDMFLSTFEKMMVDTIIHNRARLFSGKDSEQAIETLLKVALRYYDRNLLEQGLAHSLNRAFSEQGDGHTYAYSVKRSQNKESAKKLQAMVEKYKGKDYKKVVIISDI